jgi:hypothetical protein
MSAHTARARNRHPEPATFGRERFQCGHVTFEVINHPENGATFALLVGDDLSPRQKPLFSGHITSGMGTALRRLAHRIDELEPETGGCG